MIIRLRHLRWFEGAACPTRIRLVSRVYGSHRLRAADTSGDMRRTPPRMFEQRAVWRAAFEMTSSPVMIDPATYRSDVLIRFYLPCRMWDDGLGVSPMPTEPRDTHEVMHVSGGAPPRLFDHPPIPPCIVLWGGDSAPPDESSWLIRLYVPDRSDYRFDARCLPEAELGISEKKLKGSTRRALPARTLACTSHGWACTSHGCACVVEVQRTALLPCGRCSRSPLVLQQLAAAGRQAGEQCLAPWLCLPSLYTMVQMIFQVVAIGSLFLFVPETVGDWLSRTRSVSTGGLCASSVGYAA